MRVHINVPREVLEAIDMLVSMGIYRSRSEAIRKGIEMLLEVHGIRPGKRIEPRRIVPAMDRCIDECYILDDLATIRTCIEMCHRDPPTAAKMIEQARRAKKWVRV